MEPEAVEHEQHAAGQALHLQTAPELLRVAEAKTPRAHDQERHVYEHEHAGEPGKCPLHRLSPAALPYLDEHEGK